MHRISKWKFGVGLLLAGAAGYFVYRRLVSKDSQPEAQTKASGGGFDTWLVDDKVSGAGAAPVRKEQERKHLNYSEPGKKLLVLYGTEYGCSARVAEKVAELLVTEYGLQPRVMNMADYKLIDFAQEHTAVVIVSTYGDGVPPTEAREFYDWLHSSSAPSMSHMKFALLALGDSNYPLFCKSGRDFDKQFEKLGAERLGKRGESDQEQWELMTRWYTATCKAVAELTLPVTDVDYLADRVAAAAPAVGFNKQRPYLASLAVRKPLTAVTHASDKETIHFELDLGESELTYIPGDSLGVYPINAEDDVNAVLRALNLPASTPANYPSWHYKTSAQKQAGSVSLFDVLSECYDLKTVKPELLQLLLENTKKDNERDQLAGLLAGGSAISSNKALAAYLYEREIIDILESFSARPSLDLLLSHLGRLLPRYYSISSSQRVNPKRVSLTVAIVRYETLSRQRRGVCSTYLADRVQLGQAVAVFVNNNPDFRMPADPAAPLIMVGPGTGLAPFRAFLQERSFHAEKAKAMLFFGCRSAKQDFLYSDELAKYESTEGLALLTAFSRDQARKVYVQDRLLAAKDEVWALLQSNAHFYVCGDAAHMAGDVHTALTKIVMECGGKTAEDAAAYIAELEHSHRYQKDTWF